MHTCNTENMNGRCTLIYVFQLFAGGIFFANKTTIGRIKHLNENLPDAPDKVKKK